jgi:hypothetical protein
MTVYPPEWEQQHAVGDPAAPAPELDLFARIEGLTGEEHALLQVPGDQRTTAQHDRLHAIARELDRAWDKLRERAERLARPPAARGSA